MNNMEEQLWEYIDGRCTTAEEMAIELLMAQNTAWKQKYDELIALNNEITTMELHEPSMGFNFKVMEQIRGAEAKKPLKTAVNPYLIKGIAAFFIVAMTALLVFTLTNAGSIFGNVALNVNIAVPNVFANGTVISAFFYLDIMLFLFFADALLRKRLRRSAN